MQKALKAAGAQAKIIAPRLGTLKTAQGHDVKIDWSFLTAGAVLFDAVFVPGGDKSLKTLMAEPRAVEFVAEAYKPLFVIHPEPELIGARALEASVARLKARLTSRAVTRGLQVFEAHPESAFCIGGVYTRRSLLKDASDALLGSSYYGHFTPEMLRAVGMPHDMPSRTMLETSVRCSRLVPPHCRSRGGPSLRATTPDHRPIPLYPDDP